MPNPEDDWGPKKEEFEGIAADLGVPSDKRAYFVYEALVFSEVPGWLRDQGHSFQAMRGHEPINALKQANQDLKNAIEAIRKQSFFFNFTASIDLSRNLAQLLDHPNARTLLPDQGLITPDVHNVE
jgi:hypothetical protein